jgi:uncharacterized protein involved in exopolysaccharide biosynthesis
MAENSQRTNPILRVISVLLRNKFYIIAATILTYSIGYVYLRYSPYVYQINGKIRIDIGLNVNLESKENSSMSVLLREHTETIMVLMKSEGLLLKVVNELKLDKEYWDLGRIKSTLLYRRLPIEIDIDTSNFKIYNTPIYLKGDSPTALWVSVGNDDEDSYVKVSYNQPISINGSSFKIRTLLGPLVPDRKIKAHISTPKQCVSHIQ